VLAALAEADLIVLPPSNPIVSIGTVLGVPGIGAALRTASAPVIGVSPVIGGRAVRGMADQLLSGLGIEGTAAGIAEHYGARVAGGLLDGWLVADSDAAEVPRIEAASISSTAVPLMMSDIEATAAMARAVLDLSGQVRA
jgi:LPPG:FO 2-phospho-L-lactate transferase